MTPHARVAAAIEILDEIARRPAPADAVLAAYWRVRRYAGSRDRAAVADLVFRQFRARARMDWCLAQCRAEPDSRLRILATLVLVDGLGDETVAGLFAGDVHAAGELSPAERAVARRLTRESPDSVDMPEAVRVECPPWAEDELRRGLGDSFAAALAALREPAPVDLRVNTLRGTREQALAALAGDGIEAVPTPYSPVGLRLDRRVALSATRAWRDGLVEVMDEGSQLLASLVAAEPGHAVVDFCAGAGGKTLALAAAMGNRGRIIAADTDAERLARARPRLKRAGVDTVTLRTLASERDKWVKRAAGRFDRVLVDAPCSGTGTWRRSPDARWTGLSPSPEVVAPRQEAILASAARLVKPGGRLVYAVCSLTGAEGPDRIARFLEAMPDFRPLPASEVLPDVATGDVLRLDPASHGTDGFFAAVLEHNPA